MKKYKTIEDMTGMEAVAVFALGIIIATSFIINIHLLTK